jgi:ABC-type histidine transport system ATPase subunit
MENNEYVIVLRNETPQEDEKKKAVADNKDNIGKSKKTGLESLEKYAKPMAMIGYAKNLAERFGGAYVNTVTLRTGYEEKQQREQMYLNLASRGANILMSIGAGAMVGNVPGAIAGAVMSIASEGINMAIRQNEINMARQQESTAIFLNQVRMGAGNRREGRT